MVQKTVKKRHRKIGHHYRKRAISKAKKAARAKFKRNKR